MDLPQYHKQAEALIRKKVIAGRFDNDLLTASIHRHGCALNTFFDELRKLASQLVHSVGVGGESVRSFGATLYELLFATWSDKQRRQQVCVAPVASCMRGL